MMTASFDTLAFAKKLQSAGFTQKQSEVQAEAIAEIVGESLATKGDIIHMEQELKRMEQRLTYRLTLRLGSLLVVGISVIATLVKIL